MREARRVLDKLSQLLAIPDKTTDEAARICVRGLKKGLAVGRPFHQIVVASLYAACRERKVPLTLDDLRAASGLDRKGIATCYRLLVSALNMNIPVVDPAEYVTMVASRAKASEFVRTSALEILSKAEKTGAVDGRNPIGLAASALYIASIQEGEGLTQRVAAEAAGVTENTLRGECQRLRQALGTREGAMQQKDEKIDHREAKTQGSLQSPLSTSS